MNCVLGKLIYTGKSVVKDSYLVFNKNKIVGISKTKKGKLLGTFPVITPAFLDAHSHIGMCRAGEPSSEAEANESMDSIMSLPDALDSIQMDDQGLRDAVEMGVLYSCVLPGSGNILSGFSAVIRNYASDTTNALIARAGVKGALGYNPMSAKDWKGTRPTTRMGTLAILRKQLHAVKDKIDKQKKARGKKKDDISFTAGEKVLRDILNGKITWRVHVHKTDDIAALLRVVDEFKLKITVEHAMDIHDIDTFRELKKRKIPVTYGPMDAFPYKVELKHFSHRNAKLLIESGAEFGLMTDHPVIPARTLLISSRWFTHAGFSKQQAIEIITRSNAKIMGVNKILGTLDKGKWASFTCWNGDPFDITHYPAAVYGEGQLLHEE